MMETEAAPLPSVSNLPIPVPSKLRKIARHRISCGGEVEFELVEGNSSTWERHSKLARSDDERLVILDKYRDGKGYPIPKWRKRKPVQPLTAGDELNYITPKNKDNCCVCLEDRSDEFDPIVYCDKCNIGVHAFCYGYPLSKKIPKDEWICEKCRFGAENERCVLCPMKKGAMKKTTDSKWAHLACAMWVPEVFFRRGMGMEAIDTFQVSERRWMNICSICKIPQGACLECCHDGCTNTFHLSCGMRRNCHLDFEEKNGQMTIYSACPYHTSFWRETQERREARLGKRKKE